MNFISVRNHQTIPFSGIPVLDYDSFLELNVFNLIREKGAHCVSYFGFRLDGIIRLVCCIANDESKTIQVSSTSAETPKALSSFSKYNLVFEKFEREIHENFGIAYTDHPWLKPVRFPFNRFDPGSRIENYPFFKVESEELHEVGVGPIHAGIIEPGHFRFICNGEQIVHLEIQLGYQHRGMESLFLEKNKLLQRCTLAENIAGDSVVGHSLAFAHLWESLCNHQTGDGLKMARTIALELERVAIHTGDLSAMCTDVAYQLGSAVFGRLRTPVINFFQKWCGNRLAKGLIRPGKTNFPFTRDLVIELIDFLDEYENDFEDISKEIFSLPSALARFEKTGVLTTGQALAIGTVGLSARMSGVNRDIRASHPHDAYAELGHQPVLKTYGDVYARARLRKKEINQSIDYIRRLIKIIPAPESYAQNPSKPTPDSFCVSLVEGWRGEICHCAIADGKGDLIHYKIKDPSFHNWLGLALAVRNNEISDFPISNKSFDLSYCGHDL